MSVQIFESPQDQRVLPETAMGVSALFQILASRLSPSPPPSSTQSAASTSTAAAITPEPRKSITSQNRDSQQSYAAILASHRIKVRDFAYESTLPPVRPVRLLQIQPEPRSFKRMRRDVEDDDVFNPGSSSQQTGGRGSSKKSKLGREVTEPDIQPTAPPPTRARGFANFADHNYSLGSQLIHSQQTEWSQPPPQFDDESQESEAYIDTPIVTPNGSLQWRVADNSNIPASQLDTESQANTPELFSYSQLGLPQPNFSQQTSQREELSPPKNIQGSSSISSSPPPSPIQSLRDSLHDPSLRVPHYPSPLRYSSSAQCNRSPKSSPKQHSPDTSPQIQSPRYHLRKRPAIAIVSPTKLSIRGRRTTTEPAPAPRHRTLINAISNYSANAESISTYM
ncbi:hypothetical protein BDZ94DRAFT_1235077 [Collybia nuda]|uniref:Uncharacterized protein n=1 Tax=Collybia nuda TaxID=64659 RepID=A0A9P6CLG3_9AGAR|nr:hypothetical protein BDZ94DRAFT_1235077 [Collybia nuda]